MKNTIVTIIAALSLVSCSNDKRTNYNYYGDPSEPTKEGKPVEKTTPEETSVLFKDANFASCVKSTEIFRDWEKGIVTYADSNGDGVLSTEEADKVTHSNLQEMLPKQTHLWARGQFYNSAFSLRHLMNNIKKIHRRDPKRSIWDIHLKDIQDVIKIR